MAVTLIPATEDFAYEDATPSPFDRVQRAQRDAFLGRGIVRPFRRGASADFANAEGVELVKACVGQILGMRASSPFAKGELPWDPERGALLYRLRHIADDMILRELGRVYVVLALRRWEPRVIPKRVLVSRRSSGGGVTLDTLVIELLYDVIRSNVSGNQVFLSNISQTVDLPLAA